MMLQFKLILVIAVLFSAHCSNAVGSFRGAVANHAVETESVDANLQLYKALMQAAATQEAHVLVFPEFGLAPGGTKNRTALRSTAEKIGTKGGVPCADFTAEQQLQSPIVFQMSCSAKDTGVAALVNMIDFVECDPVEEKEDGCPDDGFYLYNTDIGLAGGTGEFQAKYHKSHEYFGLKPQFNVPPVPDYETWTIGEVEFGLFTCYDIFFGDPPKQYIANGVKHFLYPVQMGEIGDITMIWHWSKTQNATMFVANTALVGSKDASSVYVAGAKQQGMRVPISGADASSKDSVFVADVPF